MGKKTKMIDKLINLKKVIEWDEYAKLDVDNNAEIQSMYNEAKEVLEYYDWCEKISESYVGMLYLGIVGVFLFRIIPTKKSIDEWVWVIVGDLPPAYITIDKCPNPATALDGYIGAMLAWVDAAQKGESVESLIPVNVMATRKNSDMLKTRLEFLDENILSKFENDLKE